MVTLAEIREASRVLEGHIIRTPLIYSPTFSALTGASVYLKLENLQRAGSFKVRGAMNKLLSNREPIGKAGVVAASAGNHAQGVAVAAQQAGLPATIVMPRTVSISKEKATREYGADVIIHGGSLDESIVRARELVQQGFTFIHPYDDPEIIAGQGTIGIEIMEDLPDVNMIIVPVGGGGLISGIAAGVKGINPEVRVIGAEASSCPAGCAACEQGKPVMVTPVFSIADGIMVGEIGRHPFAIIQRYVEDILTIPEDQIANAILLLLERKKILVEGAGAVPLAALLDGGISISPGSKVVLVISGGNIDMPLLDRIIRKGMLVGGRIMKFSACLEDSPGALANILSIVADQGGNIMHITHTRAERDLPVQNIRVALEIETRGPEHIHSISTAIQEAGYQIELF